MKLLENKNIVITGASRGIGRAMALACAREGANIGINFINNQSLAEELAHEIEQKWDVSCYLLQFDVTKPESINTTMPLMLDKIDSLHAWINNAAINLPGLLLSQTEESVTRQLQTNIAGPIYCCQYILPYMMQQRHGCIINIGSIASHFVSPGQAVYASTKGAMIAFTRALAKEYGKKNIRVNCIEPGPVETDMFQQTKVLAGEEIQQRIPLKRYGLASEIAELVVFLLSDRSSFITGSVFTADGGYSLGC